MPREKEYGKKSAPGFPNDFVTPLTSAPEAGDVGAAPVTGDFGAFDEGPSDPGELMPANPKRTGKMYRGTR